MKRFWKPRGKAGASRKCFPIEKGSRKKYGSNSLQQLGGKPIRKNAKKIKSQKRPRPRGTLLLRR